MRTIFATCFLVALFPFSRSMDLLAASDPAAQPEPRELWLYYPTNLQVDENVEKARQIWTRAAKAGYSHVLLADSKMAHLKDVPDYYYRNVERAKKIAADLKLTLVPAIFDVGYSNAMLSNDPNLAEGLPVENSLFVIKGGEARLEADPPVALGKPAFADQNLAIEGSTATYKGGGGNSRFSYKLNVPEFRCYHVSVKIKTQDFAGEPRIQALAGERSLQCQNLGVKKTQDWTEHHVVFNSLDNKELVLYFGVWETPATGSLAWKDWKIEEVGLLNVLRRPGTPVVVKAEDGAVLVEGKDYEQIVDPHMGNVPWNGEYQSWHEPPTIKLIGNTRKSGTNLRVSWYHPAIVYDGQVAACISEPATMQLLADQATRVKKLFNAPAYMMSHDEFRVFGWDKSCVDQHQTPGEMLAENARKCRELLQPQGAYVWSDMFDPYHNAVKGPYYLVNGPWTNSWDGLSKDVTIVNWNFGKRDESLAFFAGQGHKQIIAGYYDGSQDTAKWLESADKVRGVVGIMYTTWQSDYSKLESFAAECRKGASAKPN